MSKKKVLLEERSKIRWSQLAGIKNDAQARQALRESQVNEKEDPEWHAKYGDEKYTENLDEMGDMDEYGEEVVYDEELDYEDDDELDMADDGMDMEPEMGDDMDMGDDMAMDEPAMGGEHDALAAELAAEVADAIERVLGTPVDVESDVDIDDEMSMEPEMGDMDEPAPDLEGEPEMDMDDDLEEEPPLEETAKMKGAHADHKMKSVKESKETYEEQVKRLSADVAKYLLENRKKS